MSEGKYQKIQEIITEIKEMFEGRKTQREAEKQFGLTGDNPIHQLLIQGN